MCGSPNRCLEAIIGMFFQDGLTGSAWGDWVGMPYDFGLNSKAIYTASPLR